MVRANSPEKTKMASILEQYESELKSSGNIPSNRQILSDEPIATGYVDFTDDAPMFRREKKNFRPPAKIIDISVCNSTVIIALSYSVMRLNLVNTDKIEGKDRSVQAEDVVYKIFQDPTARHIIICLQSFESLYLARTSKKVKPISKLKGHLIEAVAWNKTRLNETTTQAILIGTRKGLIFETELDNEEKFFQAAFEKYCRQLHNINSGVNRAEPITGMVFEKFPRSDRTFVVMVTTYSRLYHFIGEVSLSEPPLFVPLFSQFETSPASFIELPSENLLRSQLALYNAKARGTPSSFAWLTGPGAYCGGLNFDSLQGNNTSIISNARLLPYVTADGESSSPPLALALTEFHVLLLYKDRFEAVCLLNDQIVFQDLLPERFGEMRGMVTDPVKKTIWIFSVNAIFEYHINKETRHVWKLYLEKGMFQEAEEYAKDNPLHIDEVLRKKAENFFNEKQYRPSAATYALTQASFEEVTLKFIQVPESDSLKVFLVKKLNNLDSKDKTQITMLTIWLVELYLNELGELKNGGAEKQSEFLSVQEDFRKLLATSKVKMSFEESKQTAYELIASHGDVENLIFLAMLMKDFERVIHHHIQHDDFGAALDVLKKQNEPELYYKFSPVLMQHIPEDTVNAWIDQNKRLDPRKLIPALIYYEQKEDKALIEQAVRYLDFCVDILGVQDQAIHNYLLSLYVKQKEHVSLMRYLHLQGQDKDEVRYDLEYALRLCSENELKQACVHIYSTMGLYEEAVDLALMFDADMAKFQASKPEEDEALQKKLWLRIARHVVEKKEDVKTAMQVLNDFKQIKIEDILPFFPDFVTIDHFKDAICSSLEEYNKHIHELKTEMQEATESAENIRQDIQEMKNRYGVVEVDKKCLLCLQPLLTRSFHIFPCHHAFHTDCLVDEVLLHLKGRQRNRLEFLKRKLFRTDYEGSRNAGRNRENDPIILPEDSVEKLMADLDELIANECILCGEHMIRSIDQPFITQDEYDEVVKSWA
ncbi:vacuolar protein sorting-associated protein 18 homolog [Xenia sp. Carnegie-2017]|uniref:vacuolar protein sorting-associated protein 18 homolog n=1 Tax=Xenia sp. Carnegie-2017 TaxID=2897299 RepID=UPI001F0366B0|nr:vacuolar protein sorting-associated protein 18 homolog [Xenia sp. Carnegie-2017]